MKSRWRDLNPIRRLWFEWDKWRRRYYIHIHDRQIGYCAIPKCANSAIKKLLFDDSRLVKSRAYRRSSFELWHPAIQTGLSVHTVNEMRQTANCLRFVILRDPARRLYSCYREKICDGDKPIPASFRLRGFTKNMPFDTFLDRVCRMPDWLADVHFRSQSSFCLDRAGSCADLHLRVEQLDADWELLRDRLKAEFGQDLPDLLVHNKKSDPSRPMVFTDQQMAKIRRRYANDYALMKRLFGA